ncbi:hypothetical protein K5549_010078 [Capra hircus]|nr:hypothetical protein K5549_010078 [Capra hircus]
MSAYALQETLLAKALYDNHPDCADELAFCRGDILTILEQNVPESEGWWKCLLHGRQGLAPANRLQILVEAPTDRPRPPFLKGLDNAPTISQETYEVPTLLNPSSPVYEQMKSWVEGPPPPTVQVYEVPDPPTCARIVCEKTLSFPKQAVFMIPRPARTSLPALACQVYDVPAQSRCPPTLKEPGTQQLYDIPPSPQKAALGPPASQTNKKFSLPEIPSYSFPLAKGAFPLDEGVSYKVPSSFLIPRVEQQNTKPNIYDIPKARPRDPQSGKELGKANMPSENSSDHNSSWLPSQAASLSPEPDSSSVSSSDSRASILSSCSSTSTDSSSSSFSEESARELPLDLDLARETVTVLQHKVANSVGGLMLFVSRKWRFRDSLEANIDAIRRAADRTEESLREFLDFAQGVCGTTCNLTNSNLQARIRDQLQTISNSYQILLETKESLESCDWSLEVLVTDKIQNSPDDLERFVQVARMVPEDVKRFASIIIANGRLLFKPNCEKEDPVQLTPSAEFKLAKSIQLPKREIESYQRNTPFHKQKESKHSPELLEKNRTNVCEQNSSSLVPQPLSQQNPEKKIRLSEHCRLYFGALFKAIGVLNSSLQNSQPPETFITQSKLVITVGQKLVDRLCRETQERDVRNEILRGSSCLCSLLKDLALATKHAVLQHPSPAALQHLQAEAKKLEQHAQQFRGMLE